MDRPSRMLLPRGAGRLRADLGAFLKRRRQGLLDGEAFGTQAQVAARVGISRQTLSNIERGAAWPGPATLDALLDTLDLGWEHVAHPVESEADPRLFVDDMPGGGRLRPVPKAAAPGRYRRFLEGREGDQIAAFGEQLRAARTRRKLTLAQVAREAAISVATLSRLERGQLATSSVFRFQQPADGHTTPELVILNPRLAQLCRRPL
ncbi:helix-turn-helix transcriptional regulator [Sphingomonas morindae]|uniref:Transcriptional regulator n=1 Tax=Sphingomonas morindae TaxID=1541170 RepID=A0ABY4X8A5_9SPHN|nr:helix-turn-helix transcriptional regulator [Sphingomonas morindae]USI72906.1 transcriptional regulator [Sphingomonas morindae]